MKLECALVDELRLCAGGKAPTLRELRLAIGCSAAELAETVQALRYQGKLAWDKLELSSSMLAGAVARDETAVAPIAAEGGAAAAKVTSPPSGPDDHDGPEDEYPGEVNDCSKARGGHHAHGHGGGFVPKRLLHKAGTHAAATRAAARPLPVPEHEPEVARQVREEVEEIRERRGRARSTGTVRQPLGIRKFGLRDLNLVEGVTSLLAENPNDLMAAINRKHEALWRRVILLGRARGERPAPALYAALEAGLDLLEEPPIGADQAAA